MTGIGPPGGVGCLISGSTCAGGQITPPVRANLSLRFRVASRCWGSVSLPFPVVLGVSEGAQAFGSSCSAMGATGAFVGGGAWATDTAGSSAISKQRTRAPRAIARSLSSDSFHKITASQEVEFRSGRAVGQTLKADQRKMAKRRHRPVFDQAYAAMTSGPIGQPAKTEFRPPAEPAGDRRKTEFESATRPRFRTDMV